ncbi:MAG: Endoribonuclease YbeY [Turneriella sp.]|nr:Endoribonuclease YbeY [Turneriella sp.]
MPRLERAFVGTKWKKKGSRTLRTKKKEEVLVHLVSDATIQKINYAYRKKRKSTDVLSFSYAESLVKIFPHEPIGEIFISLDTARKQSRIFKTGILEELAILTVHGVLHVLGYDHEIGVKEAENMRRQEALILKKIGLNREALLER